MNHTVDESPSDRAAQAAADWLALLAESPTEEQRSEFLAWLRASTLNVEEFLRLSALDRRLRRRELWPADATADLVAAAKASSVAQLSVASPTTSADARRRPWMRLAASVVLAAIAGGTAFVALQWHSGDLGATVYATEIGEQRSVTLADGSVVELNSRSRVRARYTDSERQVELLSGEAIFKVAKNPQRPFRVHTGSADIVAIGTAFNVNTHGANTVVTVLEGRVRVSDMERAQPIAVAQPLELGRGEQVVIADGRSAPRIAPVDPAKVIAWTQRRLIFENTPLADVAAEFARYHVRTIRLGNDSLKERRITGVFDAHDPASLIEFLRTDHAINVEVDEQGWKLSTADLLIGTAATEGRL